MSNPKPKRKVRHHGKTRLNLRLPADLDTWVRKYAEDNNTTLTSLITKYFTELRQKHEDGHVDQF